MLKKLIDGTYCTFRTRMLKLKNLTMHTVNRLSLYASKSLVHALIPCMLDYCNSLYPGLHKSLLFYYANCFKLCARLVAKAPRLYNSSDFKIKPSIGFQITDHIEFKQIILAFSELQGQAHSYTTELFKPPSFTEHRLHHSTGYKDVDVSRSCSVFTHRRAL